MDKRSEQITARELAEKAASQLVNSAPKTNADIILRETHLESLLKCVEALRNIYGRFNGETLRAAGTALRELDQTKGDA